MLIIDEKIIELDDLADRVAVAFMKLDVVADFKARKLTFESDAKLQQKLQTLEENKAYISYRPEICALQQEILMTDTIYQLKLAENDVQMALSELAKAISSVISDAIVVDENLPLKKGGHHGRHHH
ncbi:YlbF family regulator [Pseudolactococcus yaeyamensis]